MAELNNPQEQTPHFKDRSGGSGSSPIPPKSISRTLISGTAIAGTDKVATITIQVPSEVEWFVERMRVKTNSSGISICEVFRNAADDLHSLDYSPQGNNDISDNSKPPYFRGGDTMIVRWTNIDAGTTAKMSAQVRVEQ
jgi:hypothetical protein